MIQTLVMVIVLFVVGAVIQTNAAVIHTQTRLTLPGDVSVPITYLKLLAGLGAAAVLVWLAGMLDVALLRGRLRQRDAAVLALEQDLMRVKAGMYDKQQPALNDVRSRLEVVVQELRGMLARVESVLRGIPDRTTREGAAAIRADRAARVEAVAATGEPIVSPEDGRVLEEVGAQPRKRWPL